MIGLERTRFKTLRLLTLKKKLTYGLIVVFLVMAAGYFLPGMVTYETFDSDRWKEWEESETEWSLRWDMMNSLRNNYYLVGMTKKEVVELLGEPDSPSNLHFSYYLGYSKRGINTGSLELFFNSEGVVTRIKVWEG